MNKYFAKQDDSYAVEKLSVECIPQNCLPRNGDAFLPLCLKVIQNDHQHRGESGEVTLERPFAIT